MKKDIELLYKKILAEIKKAPTNAEPYFDIMKLARKDLQRIITIPVMTDTVVVQTMLKVSHILEDTIRNTGNVELYKIHKDVLLVLAPYDFESFIMYTEWNRKNPFYAPRRKQLRPVVEALQDLADDRLDLLAISLPPGVGKSTLALFFITWLAGRKPGMPILTGSHNSEFIRGAYDECLRMMDPQGEYLYADVFPYSQVVNTNAKSCRIDLGRTKRFETLQFTTIGSGNAGLYRAMQLLYCDDLIPGIEVAMSKDRLDTTWREYTADLRQRKQGEKCKELHIATRWSVHDVIGRLERNAGVNPRYRFLTIPALNANGESNFDYPDGLGFTTAMYEEQKRLLDDATWRAVYMNEPIEREGQLYAIEELRRFDELPDVEPDAILALCDSKDTGTDYCVLPIGYKYGDDIYVYDCVCDNGKPEVVDARIAAVLARNNTQMAQFESNNVGGKVAEKIQGRLKSMGARCSITTKYTKTNKEMRIISNSPYVKEHFLFLMDTSEHITPEYQKMLNMLVGYNMYGRNKHDDVPDAFALFAEYVQRFTRRQVEIIARPF